MRPRRNRKAVGGWLFLLLVLGVYALAAVIDTEVTREALSFFAHIMRKALPVLALVFVLLLVTDLLLSPQWIKRYLGGGSGTKGWLVAAIGGVLASGPIYPWYALLRELREKGMRASLAAVFLYSRAVKLPLLPLMDYYFGTAYTVVLCAYLLGFSILSGALMAKFEDQ